ncbi:MAG: ABC transporter ATP-binding protein, partial [Eggerthellaceae bacterium]|nr:ABC transporter ATP-binding protein [Eggerthellaceae bacterium]
MFGEKFKRKYALTDQGVANAKKGAAWTVVVNLVMMFGIGFLYFMMMQFMATLVEDADLPGAVLYVVGIVVFLVLSFAVHLMQYHYTYSVVYGEVAAVRLSLAERLRKLPLGFFGKRDLADLTETLMSDVKRLEHVWSHVLGYLYGSYISTAIIAVMLIIADWRLAIACLWGVPVAFALLFGTRRQTGAKAVAAKSAALAVSDGVQETLDNVREIRATNQEQRFLDRLNAQIDASERAQISGELFVGFFVNGASVIMRLGVATTILVGAQLMLSGQLSFMMLFMFLLVITRIYAPFDQSLALIAEVFMSEVSVDRLNGVFDEPVQEGAETFEPV